MGRNDRHFFFLVEPIQSVVFKFSSISIIPPNLTLNLYRVLYLNTTKAASTAGVVQVEPIQSVVFKLNTSFLEELYQIVEPIQSVVFKCFLVAVLLKLLLVEPIQSVVFK